ncbi:uncharacterized protein MYCFIDRAFT_88278 [Pseudocercospora fijiensis CIRAD86]|uniref:Uncharacterized protein n=1 Tax=Pseudocercospora fijiensis (strain CIRAD86) TaxID=383855 RepID=M3A4R9_PSEFD|nr:uncharacterized protein MYCFIDRAFT_88278 [Pseudocercospora fijiensis CIRAD86]EME86119.1 hypothetical protein MYCFIDRAFT_88278 [Pseudocercospora fijiensis CIRAD86]
MPASQGHDALLDQLQAQVNLVLEQTGRVFAAVNTNPKSPPTAQVNKLKQTLPPATNRFHDALHQLQSELQLAQLVLRRDLAICREKTGQQARAAVQPQHAQPTTTHLKSDPSTRQAEREIAANEASSGNPGVLDQPQDQDVTMQEPNDEKTTNIIQASTNDVDMGNLASDPQPDATEMKPAPSQAAHTMPVAAAPGLADAKQSTNALQIDTKPGEKPPDTAVGSAPGDLDSLFNDGGNDGNASLTNDFNFDTNNDGGEIDFGDFGNNFSTDNNDNDNISSLLPGLEDYANTQSTSNAELDLNALFGTGNDSQNNGMNSQGAGEQRDTTFDDLMDLANFDGTGLDDGNNNNADLDFDSMFN